MRYYTWSSKKAHKLLLVKLKQFCNHTVFSPAGLKMVEEIEEMEEPFEWTFYNAYFFALTTLSTIGQFTYVHSSYYILYIYLRMFYCLCKFSRYFRTRWGTFNWNSATPKRYYDQFKRIRYLYVYVWNERERKKIDTITRLEIF